jgi:hypothetical protein
MIFKPARHYHVNFAHIFFVSKPVIFAKIFAKTLIILLKQKVVCTLIFLLLFVAKAISWYEMPWQLYLPNLQVF